ncbi:MAG: alkaline phosphatase family protein [bacterium]
MDELIISSQGKAKVISLATKGRGAILLGGHLGQTYWLNGSSGEMTSSTYYTKDKGLPSWVKSWNKKKIADSFFNKTWDRSLPVSAYAAPDDAPYEGDVKGLGKTFPHAVNGKLAKPGPDFYEAFMRTPFANDLEIDFAKAAIAGEKLGGRGVTDLLAVSLSALDLTGHDYGPYSQEVQDLVVRTDQQIGDFVDWIENTIGTGNVLVVVAGDHGVSPIPEQMAAMGFDAFRIKKRELKETIEGALKKRFGEEKWVLALEDPHIFLDRQRIDEMKLDHAQVQRIAGEAAREISFHYLM